MQSRGSLCMPCLACTLPFLRLVSVVFVTLIPLHFWKCFIMTTFTLFVRFALGHVRYILAL